MGETKLIWATTQEEFVTHKKPNEKKTNTGYSMFYCLAYTIMINNTTFRL